jgi:hypothetical protein
MILNCQSLPFRLRRILEPRILTETNSLAEQPMWPRVFTWRSPALFRQCGVPETSKMCDDGVDSILVWGLVWGLVSTFSTRLPWSTRRRPPTCSPIRIREYLHVDPVVPSTFRSAFELRWRNAFPRFTPVFSCVACSFRFFVFMLSTFIVWGILYTPSGLLCGT